MIIIISHLSLTTADVINNFPFTSQRNNQVNDGFVSRKYVNIADFQVQKLPKSFIDKMVDWVVIIEANSRRITGELFLLK